MINHLHNDAVIVPVVFTRAAICEIAIKLFSSKPVHF